MLITCKFCKCEHESRDKRSVICNKKECVNALAKEKYHLKTKEKKCELCGETFLGKRQEKNCNSCKRKRKPYIIEELQINIICTHCSKIIETKTINGCNVKKRTFVNNRKVCDDCKKISSFDDIGSLFGRWNPSGRFCRNPGPGTIRSPETGPRHCGHVFSHQHALSHLP